MTNIPADEMMLAEILAEAFGRGLGHSVGANFRDANHEVCAPEYTAFCCAAGALCLLDGNSIRAPDLICHGNDSFHVDGSSWDGSNGWDLGYTFAVAMNTSD